MDKMKTPQYPENEADHIAAAHKAADGSGLLDSGSRRQFEGGAVRDRGDLKPRPDLISPHAQIREGMILARGAIKYALRNWELGMPVSECIASATRHLEQYKLGLTNEDHLAMARVNLGFAIHYEEEIKAGRLDPKWADMPFYVQPPKPKVGDRRIVNGKEEVFCHIAAKLAETFADPGACYAAEDIPAGAPVRIVTDTDIFEGIPDGTTIPATFDKDNQPRPFTVYLCGPITGEPCDYHWREAAMEYLVSKGIACLDPLRGKHIKDVENQGLSYKGQLAAPEIADRDEQDIHDADLILAHFPYDPDRQSIGSLMEMGAAAIGLKKPVVLCTTEPVFRDHLFCRNFTTIFSEFQAALDFIVAKARGK